MRSAFLVLATALALPDVAARAGSRRCENRCGHRVAQCVLERGGVNGREVRECTRELVAACRASRRVCPLPTAGDGAVDRSGSAARKDASLDPGSAAMVNASDFPAGSSIGSVGSGRD